MNSTGESAHHTVMTEAPARLDRLPRSRWALDDRFGRCQYRLSDGERDLPDGDPRALLSSGLVDDAVAAFSIGAVLTALRPVPQVGSTSGPPSAPAV
jgi:hypothetical protein